MYDEKYEHHKPFKELTSTEQHRQLRRLETCGIPCFSCSWLGWGGGVSDVRGFPYVALKNAYIEILCVYFLFDGFLGKENMDLKASNQKLVTKVSDLENEKAELQSELEQMQLLNKFKNTDFIKERDELQGEISELQLLDDNSKI